MNLAVVITKPGLDDAVRLGPFVGAVPAECVAGELRSAAAIAAAAAPPSRWSRTTRRDHTCHWQCRPTRSASVS